MGLQGGQLHPVSSQVPTQAYPQTRPFLHQCLFPSRSQGSSNIPIPGLRAGALWVTGSPPGFHFPGETPNAAHICPRKLPTTDTTGRKVSLRLWDGAGFLHLEISHPTLQPHGL